MTTTLIAFSCGFLLACAIFRTRRPPETLEEVKVREVAQLMALHRKKLRTPLAPELMSEREHRLKEAQWCAAQAKALAEGLEKK